MLGVFVPFYDDETRSAGEALSSLMKSKQTNMENVTIIAPPGKVKSLQSIAKLPHIQSKKNKQTNGIILTHIRSKIVS